MKYEKDCFIQSFPDIYVPRRSDAVFLFKRRNNAGSGYYWSSTLHNASDAKYLGSVYGGTMSPYGYNNRYFGFPVRAAFTFSE